MAPFEIYKDPTGEYRFRIMGSKGQVIMTSEAFKTRNDCELAIESLKRNRPNIQMILERARELMSELTPMRFELKPNYSIRLDEDFVAEKTVDGKILVYEVVK